MHKKSTPIRRILFLAIFTFISVAAFAQKGSIEGTIIDGANGKGMGFASIEAFSGGFSKGGAFSEDDGSFVIKPLDPGTYTIVISFASYDSLILSNIGVKLDGITRIGQQKINVHTNTLGKGHTITVTYVRPPIDIGSTVTGSIADKEVIKHSASRNISDIATSTATNVYQGDAGKGIQINGQRSDATQILIDGVPQRGSSNIPKGAMESVELFTSGVPAKYGDATGGFINVTTVGASKKFSGNGEFATSKFLDAYGYYLGALSINGPLLFDKKDPNAKNRRPLIGYNLSAEFQHDKDNDPSAVGMWRVKPAYLDSIEKHPLLLNPQTGFGYIRTSEFTTFDNMEKIKYKQNVAANQVSVAGKLDFNLKGGMNLTASANYSYSQYHEYIRVYSLFNPQNNPEVRNNGFNVLVRFRQKLGERSDTGKLTAAENTRRQSAVIQNAFYKVEVGFSQNNHIRYDDTHKKNIFNYGYVGKFTTLSQPTYSNGYQADSASGTSAILQGFDRDTLVKFIPGTYNQTLTNYTSQYFDMVGDSRSNIYNQNMNFVQAGGAMLNGQRPVDVNNLWYNTGRQYPGIDYSQNNTIRASIEGSLDLKLPNTKKAHAIEFGLVFEQRVDRSYSLSTTGLWTQMRLLANRQLASLDKSHPHFKFVDGIFQDTINYDRKYIATDQSHFDKALRQKLGLAVDGITKIQTDTLDPTRLTLDLFSPDELLNSGNNLVNYYGYTYTGEKLRGSPSYNDFFTQYNDENGNGKHDGNESYLRKIGAFRPIYFAGWIQDKFSFRDLVFNVGVRVDRYDANTKVLKDPYSLYATYTKGDLDADKSLSASEQKFSHGENIPSNIGSDYVVYVDDASNSKTATIIGYRNGDKWYDAKGVEVQDPSVIAKQSATNSIMPFLQNPKINITDSTFDPTTSFKDYTPQITIMPRISFSFPINDGEALFFAHYDVQSQRPTGRNFIRPDEYLNFENRVTDNYFNNPNLKPTRTIDYEIGYQQKIGVGSRLSLSALYKESKDNIQVVQLYNAFPRTYKTFGNRDFSTVKGLSIGFDQQKTQNLRFNVSYTLQFADGTGSDDASQANLINSGIPNLRTILPLSSDVRHTVGGNVDFRYGEGELYNGPVLWGKQIFSNAGIDLTGRAHSGEPYTQQGRARNEASITATGTQVLVGTINGSRLPWYYKFDIRIDKDITLKAKKNSEGTVRRTYYINAYLTVQNLLNTKNIQSVYNFTGNPNDDGYLGSPGAQPTIQAQASPQGFIDQYEIKVNNPDNYSLPRRIRIGATFNF